MKPVPLSKYFYLSEFHCHDGTRVPARYHDRAMRLAQVLDVIRDATGSPLIVVSGYRSPSWNTRVGGVPNSTHTQMLASDLVSKALSPVELHHTILSLIASGKIPDGGLGLYPSFVHYDLGKPRRWEGAA